MSLQEAPESRTLETATAVEDADHRKRKPEDSETDEADIEAKRPRPTPTVAHMIDEMDAYIEDHNAQTAVESPKEYNEFGTSESMTQETTFDNTLPSATTLTSPAPLSLEPESFFLARLPGVPQLNPLTIAKAASWFTKLLTDGNGIDTIEIDEKLGIRLFQPHQRQEYIRLRDQVAAEAERSQAQGLVDSLAAENRNMEDEYKTEDEDVEGDGVNELGTGRDGMRTRSRGAAPELDRNHPRNADGMKVTTAGPANFTAALPNYSFDNFTTALPNNSFDNFTTALNSKIFDNFTTALPSNSATNYPTALPDRNFTNYTYPLPDNTNRGYSLPQEPRRQLEEEEREGAEMWSGGVSEKSLGRDGNGGRDGAGYCGP